MYYGIFTFCHRDWAIALQKQSSSLVSSSFYYVVFFYLHSILITYTIGTTLGNTLKNLQNHSSFNFSWKQNNLYEQWNPCFALSLSFAWLFSNVKIIEYSVYKNIRIFKTHNIPQKRLLLLFKCQFQSQGGMKLIHELNRIVLNNDMYCKCVL